MARGPISPPGLLLCRLRPKNIFYILNDGEMYKKNISWHVRIT